MNTLPLDMVGEIRRYAFGSDWKTVGDSDGLPCHFCWFKAAENDQTYTVCNNCLTESYWDVKPRHFSELQQSYAIQQILCFRVIAASGAEYFDNYLRSQTAMSEICHELELRAIIQEEMIGTYN